MKPVINEIGKFVYTRGVLLDQITKLNKNFDSLLRNIFNTLKPEEIEFYAVKNHKDTFYKDKKVLFHNKENNIFVIASMYDYLNEYVNHMSSRYAGNYKFYELTENLYLPLSGYVDEMNINFDYEANMYVQNITEVEVPEFKDSEYSNYNSSTTVSCVIFDFNQSSPAWNNNNVPIRLCLSLEFLNQFEKEFSNLNL